MEIAAKNGTTANTIKASCQFDFIIMTLAAIIIAKPHTKSVKDQANISASLPTSLDNLDIIQPVGVLSKYE